MAIYHCSIKIVGRSSKAGAKSAVGAAAYRSGSRLYNSWNSANRYLRANQIDTATLPDSIKLWKKELTQLGAEHNRDYAALKKEREKLHELNRVKRKFDEVLRAKGEQGGRRKRM